MYQNAAVLAAFLLIYSAIAGAESTGEILALITWVVFGGIVVARMIDRVSWPALLYAVLSLTLIRMLPAFYA